MPKYAVTRGTDAPVEYDTRADADAAVASGGGVVTEVGSSEDERKNAEAREQLASETQTTLVGATGNETPAASATEADFARNMPTQTPFIQAPMEAPEHEALAMEKIRAAGLLGPNSGEGGSDDVGSPTADKALADGNAANQANADAAANATTKAEVRATKP